MSCSSRPLAVLIDGDNAQSSLIEHILAATRCYNYRGQVPSRHYDLPN